MKRHLGKTSRIILFAIPVLSTMTYPLALAGSGQETVRGRETAAKVLEEWPIRGPGEVSEFVRRLGKRLSKGVASGRSNWSFTVIRDRSANAFSIGGGRIYLTDGAISTCTNEAELAAMIAHEMGHELAGHFADAGCSRRVKFPWGLLAMLGFATEEPEQVSVGSLTQEISPAQEIEADRVAVRLLIATGYDPRAMLAVVNRAEADSAAGSGGERAKARLEELRLALRGVPERGRRDSVEFQRVRRRMREEERDWTGGRLVPKGERGQHRD